MPTAGEPMTHPLISTRRVGQVISISLTPAPTVEVAIGGDPSTTVFVPLLDMPRLPQVNDYVMLLGNQGDYVCIGTIATATSVLPTENAGHVLATTTAGGSLTGIAHGLNAPSTGPTAILFQYVNPNIAMVIRTTARSATTFDVNCRDDTGGVVASTTVSFDWFAWL